MFLNSDVGEDSWDCKETQSVNPKGYQSWIFIGRADAEAETSILWPLDVKNWLIDEKRSWCWERLKEGGEVDDRRWGGWMASLMRWTWVWVSSESYRWIEKPSVLQSMGSQRIRHYWVTELTNTACGILVPWPGIPHPLHWKCRVLTSGRPGKS